MQVRCYSFPLEVLVDNWTTGEAESSAINNFPIPTDGIYEWLFLLLLVFFNST